MKYRSNNINLKGYTNLALSLYGCNTIRSKENYVEGGYNQKINFDSVIREYKDNKDFSDLKAYITNTFIHPLVNHKYDFLEENLFNIFYVLDTLETIKDNEYNQSIINEIDIFINIVKIFKNNITNKVYIKNVIEKSKSKRNTTLYLTTERISLKRELEVYIALYGYPEKNEKGAYNFEKNKLDEIKYILSENPGCYYQEIKEQLHHA